MSHDRPQRATSRSMTSRSASGNTQWRLTCWVPALGIRSVLPHMRRERRGSIINVASIYRAIAVAGEAAYHASKAALLGTTRNAAATYSEDGIRVNALLPGLVMTPMTIGQDPASNAALVAATSMKRAASPDELVGAGCVPRQRCGFVRDGRGPGGRRRPPGRLRAWSTSEKGPAGSDGVTIRRTADGRRMLWTQKSC